MRGLMQPDPLVLTRILERATWFHPRTEVVTHRPGAEPYRLTYADLGERVARLAQALRDMGVGPGDRVASYAWNTWRHLELYLAVPCLGAVLHTLNIRLAPEEAAWVANHAEDRVAFVDGALAESFAPVRAGMTTVERVVRMGEGDVDGDAYEELLASSAPLPEWPELDEDSAALMCYTSGTTGRPKGVVYSHRSVVLHTYMTNLAGIVGLTDRDVLMPVVPMFHAAAWGLPHAAVMAGSKIVLAGEASADPATLARLIASEGVTVSAGVPTVWIALLEHLRANPADLSSLRLIKCGGAAVPAALIERFERELGVEIRQGWGMTETGPLASLARLGPEHGDLPEDERYRLRAKAGRVVPGIRFRILDPASGEPVPWDAKSVGELQVRGPWVASGYYGVDAPEAFDDGWLRTGDVGTVDEHGFVQLVDRTKDLVKSGGEWISSVELENALMGHPDVVEAAVIAVPDERWSERPLAVVVARDGSEPDAEELRAFLGERFPKWWVPERIEVVEAIPRTSVGKFDKRALRAAYRPEGRD